MLKKYCSIFITLFITLLMSCSDNDDEKYSQYTLNSLSVESISFTSVKISGSITSHKEGSINKGGYILGSDLEVDTIFYKDIYKEFSDTLYFKKLDGNYWIQSFVEESNGLKKGEKTKFKISDYRIYYEKYIIISHEMDSYKYPISLYDFEDCILDNNDNIILVGGVGYNPSYPYMVKINKEGEYMWHHTLSNIPEQWSGYSKIFLAKDNSYIGLVQSSQTLYISKITTEGKLISLNSISLCTGRGSPHHPQLMYDSNKDLFTLQVGINEYYSDDDIRLYFKKIEFNSLGNVTIDEKLDSNIKYKEYGYLNYSVGKYRYYVSSMDLYHDGSIISKADENLNIIWQKELIGYSIKGLVARNNGILIIASTIGRTWGMKFFEMDNYGNIHELSQQWNIVDPYVYSIQSDENDNVFICGGNSPFMFNEFGAFCVISNANKILLKEQNFGIDLRIGISIVRHKFIRKMSDGTTLLIGQWNPDFYDGPISKIYLRKFSY